MPQIRRSTKTVYLVLLSVVVIISGVVWLSWESFESCAPLSRIRRAYHTVVLRDKDFMGREVRFKSRGAGTLLLPNGRLGGFTTVRASDCVDVAVESEDEGLPAQAEGEMEKKIQRAVRVIDRGPIIGPSGEPLGERAVLLEKEEPNAEIVVLYKGKRYVGLIKSTSLAHALAFEKLTQNGYRIDANGYVIAQGR